MVENLGEMEMATRRAQDAGFDYISFKPFLARAEDGAEVMDPSQAEREHARLVSEIRAGLQASSAAAQEGFRVVESINLKVFLDGSWQQYTRQPQVCHMQAMRQVLSPLGVFNCPAHRGVGKARIGEKGAWATVAGGDRAGGAPPAAAGTAEILDRFDASSECKEVTCLYHSVNHFLEGIVSAAGPIDDLLPRIDHDSDCFL